ncbi:MAG: hypothetical protein J7559_12030, partial [Cohnella sp.]|nr:hypothetical protein [Cohnella sp.]
SLAFTTAALVFSGAIRFEHILVMAFLLGISNTFDMPTRQSMNIELVGRDDINDTATTLTPSEVGAVHPL